MRIFTLLGLLTLLLMMLNGCGTGVLIGNVKPVDKKSESYGVMDLTKGNPDWIKLETPQDATMTSTEVSDVAFQSKGTASIVSLNSACRESKEYENKDLRSLTNVLLLGASDVTLRDEQDLTVSGTPALQTTIKGTINGEKIMLRTVVIKRRSCVYDLVYVARPQTFDAHVEDFSHFVASLRLK